MTKFLGVVAIASVLASGALAQAQNSAKPNEPATPPKSGETNGTGPGEMGSTGWTGGTGGSHIGTSNHAPTPGSPTSQPPTAGGLDPTKPSGN